MPKIEADCVCYVTMACTDCAFRGYGWQFVHDHNQLDQIHYGDIEEFWLTTVCPNCEATGDLHGYLQE